MNKKQRARLRQPKKNTGFFSILIQCVAISSLIIVFTYIFLIGEKPFLITNSWARSSKILIAILMVILGLGFFKLTLKDVTESLTYNFGVLLIHGCLCLGMGLAISSLIVSFSSISATQFKGEPVQDKGIAQKWYNSGRGCHHYLKIKLENMRGDICISPATYEQLSSESFDVSVEGQKSHFGMIVNKWHKLNNPQ